MMLIGLFAFVLAVTTINAQCSDKRAICIDIRNCSSVIAILQRENPLSAETVQAVRSLKCGMQNNSPMICCLDEMTPTTAPESPSPPDVSNHPNLRLLDPMRGPFAFYSKIIGTNKAGIFEFPWMALLSYNISGKTSPELHCGGTIISSRYILTAAHCVTSLPPTYRLIGVKVGDHDTSKERDCEYDEVGQEIECAEPYQEFGVENVHYHSDYAETLLHNDIALIRLNSSVDFRSLNVKSICLPYGNATNLKQRMPLVTGWGYTIKFSPRSSLLLQARVSLLPNEYCKEFLKPSTEIWYKQLCANSSNNFALCPGDSGEPLQAPAIYYGQVRAVQYGIVSFGLESARCGTKDYPRVYTNVAYYMDWIFDTMTD